MQRGLQLTKFSLMCCVCHNRVVVDPNHCQVCRCHCLLPDRYQARYLEAFCVRCSVAQDGQKVSQRRLLKFCCCWEATTIYRRGLSTTPWSCATCNSNHIHWPKTQKVVEILAELWRYFSPVQKLCMCLPYPTVVAYEGWRRDIAKKKKVET
jgi:hypothetical protein